MICPKCGVEQGEEKLECMRCGVIFAKLTPEDFAQSHDRSSTSQSSVKKAKRPTAITVICIIGILGIFISALLIFFSSSMRQSEGRFIAFDNGTVADTRTNLMWASKDNGSHINWANAKSYCDNYRGGGYSDWRLPTQDELEGLYDKEGIGYTPVCAARGNNDKVKLTNLITLSCWGGWASETRGSEAAGFDFLYGKRFWVPLSIDFSGRALPVRSGK
jgi:hypothetical protein